MHPRLSSNSVAKDDLEVLLLLPLPPVRIIGKSLWIYSALRTDQGLPPYCAGSVPEELPPQSQCNFSVKATSSDPCHWSFP